MAERRKLIEIALPLEAINRESAREKSIRHGHPSTLHLWWARRPLAACRAVLFASLVDDPSAHPDQFPTEEAQEEERQRLFRIIEELVKWENSTNEQVLAAARAEILRSTDGNPPPVLDPFCGGGSIPLEAQRLGLEAHGSDLNPVAVLITKALIEIPPRFAGLPPVNPDSRAKLQTGGWKGAQGLAEDVRFYGRWMRDQAAQRIGHLYPKVTLPAEQGGGEATVIAWLWARTVRCPNPACGAEMPLVRSFALSTKKGKQAWVEPIVDAAAKSVRFEVRTGVGIPPEGTVNRQGASCIVCGSSVAFGHIRSEACAGGMDARLMAIVTEGERGKVYVAPDDKHVSVAASAEPARAPDTHLPEQALGFRVQAYGMTKHRDLFTDRQLVALTTFSDLVSEARERVLTDATAAIASGDWTAAGSDRPDARASGYADAVATYLAFLVDKGADYWSTVCSWHSGRDLIRSTFARPAIPMVWDFAEGNPFSGSAGAFSGAIEWVARVLMAASSRVLKGLAHQLDATAASDVPIALPVLSTDPPYYDNIGYADLSDFFYVWLRRSLKDVYPDLFSTLLTPKEQELVATPYRSGGSKRAAQARFERRLGAAFERIRTDSDSCYPVTIYYAFKQAESDGDGVDAQTASTGWETMLAGLLRSGFAVTGTWPMRSELGNRPRSLGSNALASSIVLVCRPREISAPLASRREFLAALKAELPQALRHLQHGNIAPVDLAQASIGPGMAIFSRYSKVVEADGSSTSVRTALALINQALDEVVAEQEGEFDADTRWAIAWFQESGLEAADYGRAELLSKAKNTSVQGMVEAGIAEARAGKVRLLRREELDEDWDPATDRRLTVWEMTQHLMRRLDEGHAAAAALALQLGSNAEVARDLAYRLYLICERKKWSQEGQAYNALVVAWPEIRRLAAATQPVSAGPAQTTFDV
jgi:putative DNA methylase